MNAKYVILVKDTGKANPTSLFAYVVPAQSQQEAVDKWTEKHGHSSSWAVIGVSGWVDDQYDLSTGFAGVMQLVEPADASPPPPPPPPPTTRPTVTHSSLVL